MQKEYYIYRYYNKENEIIYVGLTSRPMQERVKEHQKDKLKEETYRIDFARVKTRADMQMYEIYYINKYQPKYNIRTLDKKGINLFLPELTFVPYKDEKSSTDITINANTRKYNVKTAAGNISINVHNPHAKVASEKYITVEATGQIRKEELKEVLEVFVEAANDLSEDEYWTIGFCN